MIPSARRTERTEGLPGELTVDARPISVTTIVVFLHGAYSGRKKTCYRVMFSSLRSCKV